MHAVKRRLRMLWPQRVRRSHAEATVVFGFYDNDRMLSDGTIVLGDRHEIAQAAGTGWWWLGRWWLWRDWPRP